MKRTLLAQMNYTGPAAGNAAAASSSSAAANAGGSGADDLVLALNAATLVNGPEVERGVVPTAGSRLAPPPVAGATVVGGDDLVVLD